MHVLTGVAGAVMMNYSSWAPSKKTTRCFLRHLIGKAPYVIAGTRILTRKHNYIQVDSLLNLKLYLQIDNFIIIIIIDIIMMSSCSAYFFTHHQISPRSKRGTCTLEWSP